jgi:ABC-type oligopeptide transport system ATPase subunit
VTSDLAGLMEFAEMATCPPTPAEQILERPQHACTQTLLAAVPRLARAA